MPTDDDLLYSFSLELFSLNKLPLCNCSGLPTTYAICLEAASQSKLAAENYGSMYILHTVMFLKLMSMGKIHRRTHFWH